MHMLLQHSTSVLTDYIPARNSRGYYDQWLGIDKGATWTHSGEQLSFNNWKDASHGNQDLNTVISRGKWEWQNTYMASEKASFICERENI